MSENLAFVDRVRSQLASDRFLAVDAWGGWDAALRANHAAETAAYDVRGVEEPLPNSDVNGLRQLRQGSPVAIASGEHALTTSDIRGLIEQEAVDILRPDPTWCGGLSAMPGIRATAAQAGISIATHTAVLAANVHDLAVTPPSSTWLLEYPCIPGHYLEEYFC